MDNLLRVPALSVVIIVGARRERFERCLASVLSQPIVAQIEVLVIDCAMENAPLPAGHDHPSVRLLRHGPRGSYGELRALGVQLVRGPLVAFIEEHVYVSVGWAAALLRAFEGPWAGVGGEVLNANPGIGISDIVWIMNYDTLPPARRGLTQVLPGHNSAYRRDLLIGLGTNLAGLMESEASLNWHLIARGYQLLIEPEVRFAHLNETDLLTICQGYYLWNRIFGATRVRLFAIGWPERLLRCLSVPIVPWWRVTRILARIARCRPDLLPTCLRAIPIMLIAQYSGVIGMAVGMVMGKGATAERFRNYELTIERRQR